MDIHSKIIVCTTLDESGSTVRKDSFDNSFDRLEEYLSNFNVGDKFVMESTEFYEPLYDFIESHGFEVKLANPLKIRLIAESRMKNRIHFELLRLHVDHEVNPFTWKGRVFLSVVFLTLLDRSRK